MNKKSFGKQLLIILLQSIPVILGIFIALYVNDKAAEKKDKELIEILTSKAKVQMVKDTSELSNFIKSHDEMIELFSKNLDNDKTIQELIIESNGLNIHSSNPSYLKMLNTSKLEHMELNKASKIFELLELIKGKEIYEEQIQQNIYEVITENSKKSKMKFMMMLNDYSMIEMRLLESHKQFLLEKNPQSVR